MSVVTILRAIKVSVLLSIPYIFYLSSAVTINVCTIICDGGKIPYCIGRSGPALDIGIEKLRQKLPEVEVNFYVNLTTGMCGPQDVGAIAAQMFYQHGASVFIGPGCSSRVENVALMAKSWNIPLLTPVGSSGTLADKNIYTTLTRLSYDQIKLGKFFINVLEQFSWRNIAVIYDVSYPLFKTMALNLIDNFSAVGFVVSENSFDSKSKQLDIYGLLQRASSLSRVFVITCYADTLREMLLKAQGLGMTEGDYAFIYYRSFIGDSFGDYSWKRGDSSDQIAMDAYEALLIVTLMKPNTTEFVDFEYEVKTAAKDKYGYDYGHYDVNPFVTAYHDAFLIYGDVVNETIADGGDIFDGENITGKMRNRTFDGITGKLRIDENGDRETDFTLLDMDPVSGNYNVVGFYHGSNGVFEWHEVHRIHWPNNAGPPVNMPKCGYTGDAPECQNYVFPTTGIIGAAFSFAFLITLSVAIFIYRRMKQEALMQSLWWKISFEDLTLTKDSKRSTSRLSLCALSDSSKLRVEEQVFTKVGVYKGNSVAMKKLNIQSLRIDRSIQIELIHMREIPCQNLTKFIGLIEAPTCVYVLEEYCSRGSLEDILQNDSIQLDMDFKLSLIHDIIKGMNWLHNSPIIAHGHLTSSNCVIDSRFVLKISDFGIPTLRSHTHHPVNNNMKKFQWTAPEILRDRNRKTRREDLQPADVYSFAMILYEILTRKYPFEDELDEMHYDVIISELIDGQRPLLRPSIVTRSHEEFLVQCMKTCWSEDPKARPQFSSLRKQLQTTGDSDHFLDKLLKRMESYANNLEELVEERTQAFLEEKKRAEQLLYQVLPKSVADELKVGKTVQAEAFDCVTIYFSDIVGFTSLSSVSTPIEIVDFLNDLYTSFDEVIENFVVYKVETIGDAYMVVSGLPIRNGSNHVIEIARMSLAIRKVASRFKIRHLPDQQLRIRIGIHSGSVCAGVVGRKMPRYCLFGDTVNTASRMESNGEAMKIHVSQATYEMLTKANIFEFVERGNISIKGKGMMTTYWMMGEKDSVNDMHSLA